MNEYRSIVDEVLGFLDHAVEWLQSLSKDQPARSSDKLLDIQDARSLVARTRYFFQFPIANKAFRDESGLADLARRLHEISFTQIHQRDPWFDFIRALLKIREAELSAYWVTRAFQESHPSLYHVDYAKLACDSKSIRLLSVPTPTEEQRRAKNLDASLYTYQLAVYDIDSPVRWDCLSYTWAAPVRVSARKFNQCLVTWWQADYWNAFVMPIIVNGRCVLCTPNLGDYLVIHNNAKQSRLLWTDFLCIDQNSISDKAHQISTMQKTYEKAQSVNFWVGLPGAHAAELKKLTDYYSAAWRKEHTDESISEDQNQSDQSKLRRHLEPRSDLFANTYRDLWEQFPAVFKLRNAFTRRWILQEIHLSPKVTLLLGNNNINFATLLRLMHEYTDFLRRLYNVHRSNGMMSRMRAFGLPLPEEIPSYAYHQLVMKDTIIRDESQSAMTMITNLMQTATSFRNSRATDSLLGLRAFVENICKVYHCPVPIDVSKSQIPKQLFETFVSNCLSSDPTLSMLELCLFLPDPFYFEQDESLSLASWAPNFYKMSFFKYEGLSNTFLRDWSRPRTASLVNYEGFLEHHNSKEGHDSKTKPFHRSFHHGRMTLSALKYTEVRSCVSLRWDSDPFMEKWDARYDRIFDQYMNKEKDYEVINGRRSWINREIDNYFAFLLLTRAGKSDAPKSIVTQKAGETTEPLARFLKRLETAEEDAKATFETHKKTRSEPSGRAFFEASDSKYGAGPLMQREGDEVWLLQGASFLMTLRPVRHEAMAPGHTKKSHKDKHKTYKIIGTCLVHDFDTKKVVESKKYHWETISIV